FRSRRRAPPSTLFPYTTLFRSAASVRLVRRRARFRAAESVVTRVRELGIPIITDAEVTAMFGDDRVREVEITQKGADPVRVPAEDRKSTRLNSSHVKISYAVFC